jgi:hypothetical protein
MKKKSLLFVLLVSSLALYPQQPISIFLDKSTNNLLEVIPIKQQFLDTLFQAGRITYKSGSSSSAYINYNIVSNSIYFLGEQNKAYMLDRLIDIAIISYGKRIFMPITPTRVAEVIVQCSNGTTLLLQRQSKISNSRHTRGPYGTSTETSSLDRVEVVSSGGFHTDIDRNLNVKVDVISNYFIINNGKQYSIRNFKSLKKLFPLKWDEISSYIKEKELSFSNSNDMISLINFCSN